MGLRNKFGIIVLFFVLFVNSVACKAQERDLDTLIMAIAKVESKGNEKAVSRDCVGYLQIRPVLVKECNNILKQKRQKGTRYTLSDRLSKEKSIEMFYLIQDKYNPTHDIEKALCVWNAGPGSRRKPQGYINKVMREYNKLKS